MADSGLFLLLSNGHIFSRSVVSQVYYTYMMASRSRVLYAGVTNDLRRRVREHKSGTGSHFTRRYRVKRLVWYQRYTDVREAIAMEKRLKGWRRSKKVALIEQANPDWRDLAASLDP